jgi:hypothetical protein
MCKKIILLIFLINSLSFSLNAKKFECRTINFSNSTYVGQYYNNTAHGYGVIKWNDGTSRYLGVWNQGLREGFGFYYWAPDQYYYGQWKNAKREGYGVYVNKNKKEQGLWKDNSLETPMALDTSSILILSLDAAMKASNYC